MKSIRPKIAINAYKLNIYTFHLSKLYWAGDVRSNVGAVQTAIWANLSEYTK